MEYKPQFLSEKHYITFVAMVETLIQTQGNDAVSPAKVAENMDRLFMKVNNPKLDQMSQLFMAMNIFSVLTKGRKFYKLKLKQRRSVIDDFQNPGRIIRWIDRLPITEGISRDLVRGLKVICSVGYYSAMASKRQVGFVPFEERESTKGKDQNPINHTIPMA